MTYDATYHRRERMRALAQWSEGGVLERRTLLPIERAFADRVRTASTYFFRPVPLSETGSVEFHRQLSYLIDAFDSLPERVDVAFDSTWKTLEVATLAVLADSRIHSRLMECARIVDPEIIELLTGNFPVQSCEFLFKRIVSDAAEPGERGRPARRAAQLGDPAITEIFTYLRSAYGDDSFDTRRKGAMLLRRVMNGEEVTLGAYESFSLEPVSRARILLSLFLYVARNDRFHGDSFSPFVSSAASIRTYTHPYFSFLASYYLLLAVWLKVSPELIMSNRSDVLASLRANLEEALRVFGRHWER